MKNGIEVYEDAFSTEDCDMFIGMINSLEKNNLLFREQKFDSHEVDHKGINLHHYYDLPAWSCIGEVFFEKLKPFIEDYINVYSILQNTNLLYYDVKAKKIPQGGGFHNWHYESSGLISSSRAVVVQLYLNDDFEAGETEFLYMNTRIPPKKGRLVVFPTAYPYTHRGNPPIGGEKYILTTWGTHQSS